LRISGRLLMDSSKPLLLRCLIHRCRRTFAILPLEVYIFHSLHSPPSAGIDTYTDTDTETLLLNHTPNLDSHDSS
jgi:hypothetical protein